MGTAMVSLGTAMVSPDVDLIASMIFDSVASMGDEVSSLDDLWIDEADVKADEERSRIRQARRLIDKCTPGSKGQPYNKTMKIRSSRPSRLPQWSEGMVVTHNSCYQQAPSYTDRIRMTTPLKNTDRDRELVLRMEDGRIINTMGKRSRKVGRPKTVKAAKAPKAVKVRETIASSKDLGWTPAELVASIEDVIFGNV